MSADPNCGWMGVMIESQIRQMHYGQCFHQFSDMSSFQDFDFQFCPSSVIY